MLRAVEYETEACCDNVRVLDATGWQNSTEPWQEGDFWRDGQEVMPGARFQWSSDGSVTARGWRICAPDPRTSPPKGLLCEDCDAFPNTSNSSAANISTLVTYLFRVDSGGCEYDPESDCVTSPGWPAPYGANETCKVTLMKDSYVRTELFDIELCSQLLDPELTVFCKSRTCSWAFSMPVMSNTEG